MYGSNNSHSCDFVNNIGSLISQNEFDLFRSVGFVLLEILDCLGCMFLHDINNQVYVTLTLFLV